MKNDFFKDINGYPLDHEQQEAAMSPYKFNLILAGAGSGKTLTMIGKIKYLLEVKKIPPEEIICISFTNEAVNSLKQKINNDKIKVFTFHKLAIYLLEQEDIYYEIVTEDYLSQIIDQFFQEPSWPDYLKKQIQKFYKIRDTKKIMTSPNYQKNKKIILSFINLYSAHNLTKEDLKPLLRNKKNDFLFIIYGILVYYEQKKAENHYFDFDDLIKKACLLYQNKTLPFKEIIIDEFQDTSLLRLELIQTIENCSHANLTVVGDDFQSIYKFSGCDLDIFLNFQKLFPGAVCYRIQTTYRNSNELIKIAGDFVMKNKAQMPKELKSNLSLKHPIKIIRYFNRYKALIKAIKDIPEGNILILGRNNFDLYKFIPKEKITWLQNGYFTISSSNRSLRYLTIHKSKGLESDQVIIINLENDVFGFPSQQKNHYLLNNITKAETFLYEEERRLFYVALTRTKNYCYLLVPYFKPSVFALEIQKML